MSNPISTLPKASQSSDSSSQAKTDEIDQILDAELDDEEEKTLTETEPLETSASDAEEDSETTEETAQGDDQKSSWGLVALILAALLVGSVAINLKQSRDVATLETQNAEIEEALDGAIAQIDAETSRANGAEAALGRVDSAVDVVNERVLGLQEALDGLRNATVR